MVKNNRLKKTTIATLVISIFWLSSASAQEPSSLDLEESIKLAITNNRLIHASQKDMALAREKIKEAKTVFLPQISRSSSYTYLDEPSPISLQDQIYEHQLNLSQFLWDGGQARTRYEQVKAGLSLSKWQYEETKQEFIFQVKKAYFGLLGAQKLREVAEESVKQLRAHYEMVEKHIEVGILSSVELLRAEVELARAQANLIEAENGLSLAKASFNSLLGREEDVEVKIEDVPKPPPVAGLPPILKQRPELEQMAENIKIAGLGIKAAKKSRFPILSAFASYSRTGDEFFGNEDSWMTGLTFSYDLWDWGRKRSRIRQVILQKEQIEDREALLRDQISLEIKRTSLDLAASSKKIEVEERAVKAAKEAFRVMSLRFEEGLATNTDVLDTQLLLSKARADYHRAVYSWYLSQAALERACGIREEVGR